MIDWACQRAGVLLERRSAGIAEHERLLLEQHLAECPRCSEQSRVLAALVEHLSDGDELSPHARARALSSALTTARSKPLERPRPLRVLPWAAALGALIVGLVLSVGRSPVAQLRSFATPPVLDTQRWDDLELRGTRAFALAHAQAVLQQGSVAHWLGSAKTLRLDAGSVHVDVDPSPGKPFAVTTPRFRVDVVGTVFDVSLESVRVSRGRVRVTPVGGEAVEVGVGESWSAPGAETLPPPSAAPRPEIDAAPLLARARKALASGDVGKARASLAVVLAQRSRPVDLAEARTLLAECALVAGDTRSAQKGYADVASRHAGTAAGDSAAFAAARLERDPIKARGQLNQYLASYPNGRFREEAKARLAALRK
ncbi:MAG: FecR domain-containing protein [Myxococcales bacterium]|nr:FecR domain-containing protein [Myxococcales bacterium]